MKKNVLRRIMNPYIEILRPGNAIMGAIVVVLVAIIDKTFSLPILLATLAVFLKLLQEMSLMTILITRLI